MSSSNRRSNNWHNLLLRIVITCIALNVIVQISLHLHLDRHLAFNASPLELTRQGQLLQHLPTNEQSNNKKKNAPIIQNTGITTYKFSKDQAAKSLQIHGREAIFQPLRAYIEKELNDTVPHTVDTGNLEEKRPKIEVGRPGRWYVPLPLREGGPDDVSLYCKSCCDCVLR
jgi:hypothetical protein